MNFESDYDKNTNLLVGIFVTGNDMAFTVNNKNGGTALYLRLPKVIQLRNYLTQQIELQQSKENTMESKELKYIRKLLNENLSAEPLTATFAYIDELLSENEKYKKEIDHLKAIYNEFFEASKSEIEGQREQLEKLKGENEELTKWNDMLVKNLSKIPNVITKIGGEHAFCHAAFDTFIKNALAKERESGWYVVLHKDWNKRKPLYYSKESNGWGDRYFIKEIEHQYDNSCFSYISQTPIDLGELK